MSKPIVVISKKIHQKFYESFNEDYQLKTIDFDNLTKNEFLEQARDAHGICTMLSVKVDDDFLAQLPQLNVISNYAVGFNNIDLESCRKRNIAVGFTPDVLSFATAEIAILLTISASRNLRSSFSNVLNGQWKTWEPLGFLGQDLRGKTLGVYGLGRIGEIYAEKMQNLYDMKVIYHNRNQRQNSPHTYVSFEELIEQSDVLSLHAPATDENAKIFNRDVFQKMKPNVILVNTARGKLINEIDLFDALKHKKIFAAAVDVTDPEPMQSEHPLLTLDNFLCLPHIGSATTTARAEMAYICAENIKRGLTGRPLLHEVKI